jgi:colanic acid/amylovoran biosynthesis protein
MAPPRTDVRVLVVNAHSTLNRGDAAILDGVIATLRACGADHIIVAAPCAAGEVERRRALGADETVPMLVDPLTAPRWIRARYPALALWVIWHISFAMLVALVAPRSREAIRAYRDVDIVMSSGGGYLGGTRPGANVLNLFQIAFARVLGRRAVLAPVTVKAMSPTVERLVSAGLRGARVFARDLPTIARLADLGIEATYGSDPAFRSPTLARAAARSRPQHAGLVVAWAPRQFGPDHDAYQHREAIEDETVVALSALVRDQGAHVLLVPQSNVSGLEDDLIVIDRVLRRLPDDLRPSVETLGAAEGIEEAVAQFARADVLVSSRMHAAIMALFAGTPSLVVGYEEKVKGVFERLGLSDWVIDPRAMPAGGELASSLAALANDSERRRIGPALERARAGFGELDATLRLLLASPGLIASRRQPRLP